MGSKTREAVTPLDHESQRVRAAREAEHFPDAPFHEVGVGHLPWLDEPETYEELIGEFFSQHSETASGD